MPNPILLENYRIDVASIQKNEESLLLRITLKGNLESFKYLSKYIAFFKKEKVNFTEISLAIDDDVDNFDLKSLGLLILYSQYLTSKTKDSKCILNILYNENDDYARNSRFYNLLNTVVEKPSFLLFDDQKRENYFEIVNKVKAREYSSRAFPFY